MFECSKATSKNTYLCTSNTNESIPEVTTEAKDLQIFQHSSSVMEDNKYFLVALDNTYNNYCNKQIFKNQPNSRFYQVFKGGRPAGYIGYQSFY